MTEIHRPGVKMTIYLKNMAVDIEGNGKVVRIKSGGLIVVLLFMTLSVICLQNYVNAVTESVAQSEIRTASSRATGTAKTVYSRDGRMYSSVPR
ncbi:MAG: hypothetical protein SFU56_11185 [Capsulimonadales bacterium]|nr:hypothetical protein [Capsulimonadales bacterium]